MMKSLLTTCLFLLFHFSVLAQAPAPCSTEAYRQFDFWAGEWDVYDTRGDTLVGRSHIKNILNNCVIEENWSGKSGFEGKSFNTYNPIDSTWNQVWVDQGGATYHFSGKFANNVMALKGSTKTPRGTGLFDLSFTYNPKEKTIRQLWKLSTDQGATWSVLFDGTYKRWRS